MTAAQDEAWIQGSLARLEQLEAQREKLAASGQAAALAEIDEEIRALYEVLESAAGEEQAPANTGMPAPALGMAAAPAMGAPPLGMAPMAASAMHQPMAAPPLGMAPAMQPMAAPMQPPMGMAPAMQPMAAPMQPPMGMGAPGMAMDSTIGSSSFALDDDKPSRSPLPFIIGGLVVVALGVGGVLVMSGTKDKEAKPAPTEPAKEIKAGAIAEDTQEPVVAKGADADRTSGTKYRESPDNDRSDRRSSSGGGGGGGSRPRSDKKDDGRKITVEKSRDPLAGID